MPFKNKEPCKIPALFYLRSFDSIYLTITIANP